MKLLYLIALLYYSLSIFPQSSNNDFHFIQYLLKNNRPQHSLYYLNHLPVNLSADTINYLKGYSYYLLKKPDSASVILSKVSSPYLYNKSKILSSLNFSYIDSIDKSIQIAKGIIDDENESESLIIKNILLSGNYLLQKRYDSAEIYIYLLMTAPPVFKPSVDKIKELSEKQKHFHKKSPLAAGALSAIIPGLGKLYAGRKGEAMTMFTANIIFAGFTLEAYYRTQTFKSPTFIVFGTLFSFFYTGNIIGSIHSARRQNISKQKQIKNEILAEMHYAVSNILD